MHAFGETGPGVPAFLAKLWRLVEDPETNNLICWNKDGRSFIIQNQAQFARELLPLNYKHNNMASFIRQLNMYGFHKITSIDNGGLKFDRDEMEFSHPCFKRNCAYLLEHIKRKITNSKAIDEKSTIKPEAVSKVLSDVKAMRGRQDSLDSRFSVMKQENEALWREIASLRQKHTKQQQIVNKLIQFLITIVQPGRNMTTVKRHMQLMINDTPEQANLRKGIASECGPVIQELEEELLDEVSDRNSDLGESLSPYASVDSSRPDNESPKERPKSKVNVAGFDLSSEGANNLVSIGNTTPTIINAVNADGSEIVYHVTEVPDSVPATPESFNDENHITTPMVKEMTRIQMKSNQKKRKSAPSTVTTSSPSTKMLRTEEEDRINIKTERSDIDPLMLLNANYSLTGAADVGLADSADVTGNVNPITSIDPRLILRQKKTCQPEVNIDNDSDMFKAGNFDGSDMPSELFEKSPMIGATNDAGGSDFSQMPTSTGKQLVSVSDYGDSPSVSKNLTLQVAKVNNSAGEDPRGEVSSHLDNVQDDLDTLKDLLRGDGYSLDANTLMGLFNDSDILGPYGLLMTPDSSQNRKGSELMTYNQQSIYDLGDMMDMSDASNDTNLNGNNSKKSQPPDSVLNTPYHE